MEKLKQQRKAASSSKPVSASLEGGAEAKNTVMMLMIDWEF
jgi:hypothetical protein